MQVTDGGEPQLERVGRERLLRRGRIALCREEGGNVSGPSGEGGKPVLITPGAPGADAGAVGTPRVIRFGAACDDVGDILRGCECAVGRRDRVVDRCVEPCLHGGGRHANRRRIGWLRRVGGQNQACSGGLIGLFRPVGPPEQGDVFIGKSGN